MFGFPDRYEKFLENSVYSFALTYLFVILLCYNEYVEGEDSVFQKE